MADVLDVLRGQLHDARDQVRRLESAIELLEGGGMVEGMVGTGRRRGRKPGRPPGRPRKAAGYEAGNGRKTEAASGNEGAHGARADGRKKKRVFSAATRAKMAAAQRRRWQKRRGAAKGSE
jgi:hypothetical protein